MKNVDNRQKQSIQSRASRGFAETRKYFAHLPQDENKVPNSAKQSEEGSHHGEAVSEEVAVHRASPKAGRNEPCPCGSGKKYKKCCLGKEDPVKK